jgi:hypothetical protein
MSEETIPTLEGILREFPSLQNAYGRLQMLDRNGATCAANDIEDAWMYGLGCSEVADELAESIHATCETIKKEGE